MVAIRQGDDFDENPKTLCDWVRNFRLKKVQMKRKLKMGGDLRVCAILTTALMRAELELKRKQQERFQRWLEFQEKINKSAIYANDEDIHLTNITDTNEVPSKKREEIEKLWKCELSDIDNFMRSISSNSKRSRPTTSIISSHCSRAMEDSSNNKSSITIRQEQSVMS